jgi:hypothetical protein
MIWVILTQSSGVLVPMWVVVSNRHDISQKTSCYKSPVASYPFEG